MRAVRIVDSNSGNARADHLVMQILIEGPHAHLGQVPIEHAGFACASVVERYRFVRLGHAAGRDTVHE